MKKICVLLFISCLLTGCASGVVGQKTEITGGSEGGLIQEDNDAAIQTTLAKEDTVVSEPVVLHDPVDFDKDAEVIEIKEKFFIAQTNDMYINSEDYLGKTIKYEGIFDIFYWDEIDENIYYVIRYGPGCCGYDDNAGFEVVWDGDYPSQDDWVEAVGTLEVYEDTYDGYTYQFLRLRLSSLTVLEERGREFVTT